MEWRIAFLTGMVFPVWLKSSVNRVHIAQIVPVIEDMQGKRKAWL